MSFTRCLSQIDTMDEVHRCWRCRPCRRYRRWLAFSRVLPHMQETFNYEWTLTYRPELATRYRTTSVRHVQLAIKRARKSGYRFSYFAGPEPHKSGLLHWHVILMFDPEFHDPDLPRLRSDFHRFWGMGRTSFSEPRSPSRFANYVAGYALKHGNRALASNHLGRAYWDHRIGDDLFLIECYALEKIDFLVRDFDASLIYPESAKLRLKSKLQSMGIDASVYFNQPADGIEEFGDPCVDV